MYKLVFFRNSNSFWMFSSLSPRISSTSICWPKHSFLSFVYFLHWVTTCSIVRVELHILHREIFPSVIKDKWVSLVCPIRIRDSTISSLLFSLIDVFHGYSCFLIFLNLLFVTRVPFFLIFQVDFFFNGLDDQFSYFVA